MLQKYKKIIISPLPPFLALSNRFLSQKRVRLVRLVRFARLVFSFGKVKKLLILSLREWRENELFDKISEQRNAGLLEKSNRIRVLINTIRMSASAIRLSADAIRMSVHSLIISTLYEYKISSLSLLFLVFSL